MSTTAIEFVLREAKSLHRASTSDSLSSALPVLRRLIAAGCMPTSYLPDLFRTRHRVRRKHLLRMLAIEAGFASWEQYRPVLNHLPLRQLEQFTLVDKGCANLNLWFSNEIQARQFAQANGGRVVRVGGQAVVLPASPVQSRAKRGPGHE